MFERRDDVFGIEECSQILFTELPLFTLDTSFASLAPAANLHVPLGRIDKVLERKARERFQTRLLEALSPICPKPTPPAPAPISRLSYLSLAYPLTKLAPIICQKKKKLPRERMI